MSNKCKNCGIVNQPDIAVMGCSCTCHQSTSGLCNGYTDV